VTDAAAAVRRALKDAGSLAVLTGAGISAESGVPTFRGPGGLWRNYSPEELATPEAFERDPRLVWEWYEWRRDGIRKAQPNAGQLALAALERRKPPRSSETFTLITQNVDGLHDRAGSRRILKLHGDIWVTRCTGCAAEERKESPPLAELPPRCRCGALLRPGVVWFGEALPAAEWEQAFAAAAEAQVLMVVGTSGVVYPAAGLVHVARRAGAEIVVINPEATALDSEARWVLRGRAGEILPRLL
jgi:NAD-dependent protein deacetylase/lipoamidase